MSFTSNPPSSSALWAHRADERGPDPGRPAALAGVGSAAPPARLAGAFLVHWRFLRVTGCLWAFLAKEQSDVS